MSNKSFAIIIAGVAQPGMEEYVRNFLQRLATESRKHEGCLIYNIHESNKNPGEFMLYSMWANENDFNLHNEMPIMQEFKKDLAQHLFVYETPKTYWTPLAE